MISCWRNRFRRNSLPPTTRCRMSATPSIPRFRSRLRAPMPAPARHRWRPWVRRVQSILQQVIGEANSQYGGSYLFAGNQVHGLALRYDRQLCGRQRSTNSVTFSNGTTVQTNFDGQSIFGNTSSGIIGTLTSLASALNSGNQGGRLSGADATSVRPGHHSHDARHPRHQSQFGELTPGDANSQSTTLQSSISNLVGVDFLRRPQRTGGATSTTGSRLARLRASARFRWSISSRKSTLALARNLADRIS